MGGNDRVFDGSPWRYDYVYDVEILQNTDGMYVEMTRNAILD